VTTLGEEWRAVVGYEGLYEVSSQGSVRSLDRIVLYPDGKPSRNFKGKVLKQCLNVKQRYYGVRLSKQGKTKLWLVHQLVAAAFLGNRPEGWVICHGSQGPLCNEINNLSYGTASQNSKDQWRDGTKLYGEKVFNSKLTAEKVLQIKELRKAGKTLAELSQKYAISPQRICDIMSGRGWNHLAHDDSCGQCTASEGVDSTGIFERSA
jgi:hypothetical protein